MDSTAPKELYAVLTGDVNQDMVKRVVTNFNSISLTPPTVVHLSFHSNGGNMGDGIFLHNFFRSLPYELRIYNTGNVSSAAVPIFMAAKKRVASRYAIFMIHRVASFPGQNISAEWLAGVAEGVSKDNARLEAILESGMQLPTGLWAEYLKRDLHITADEALTYGLIQDIGDFSPPLGVQVGQI